MTFFLWTNKLYRFTPRGIVALVFSILSGLIGVAVIAWYGFAPDTGKGAAYEHATERVAESEETPPSGVVESKPAEVVETTTAASASSTAA